MTKQEAIAQVDALFPNTCSRDLKERWLEQLEGQVQLEILDTHVGGAGSDGGQLSICAPYCECYVRYLEAQIHYLHGEMTRYGNAMALFNRLYDAFAAWYHRQHLPRSVEIQEAMPCVTQPI